MGVELIRNCCELRFDTLTFRSYPKGGTFTTKLSLEHETPPFGYELLAVRFLFFLVI